MWHRQLVHDAPDLRLSLSMSRSFITASAEVASGHLLFRCEDAGHATSPRPGIHIISVFGWLMQLAFQGQEITPQLPTASYFGLRS
jgi:hypothetical protein